MWRFWSSAAPGVRCSAFRRADSFKNSSMNATRSASADGSRAPGENVTFLGEEEWLRGKGVSIEVVNDERCVELMRNFIAAHPKLWNEDIGE